jgi:peroxiredoxin
MPISSNTPAPDFTRPDETGKMVSLTDFRGKPVVLYFYPKDDTPGCTTEACNFRDDYKEYTDNGVDPGRQSRYQRIAHKFIRSSTFPSSWPMKAKV